MAHYTRLPVIAHDNLIKEIYNPDDPWLRNANTQLKVWLKNKSIELPAHLEYIVWVDRHQSLFVKVGTMVMVVVLPKGPDLF